MDPVHLRPTFDLPLSLPREEAAERLRAGLAAVPVLAGRWARQGSLGRCLRRGSCTGRHGWRSTGVGGRWRSSRGVTGAGPRGGAAAGFFGPLRSLTRLPRPRVQPAWVRGPFLTRGRPRPDHITLVVPDLSPRGWPRRLPDLPPDPLDVPIDTALPPPPPFRGGPRHRDLGDPGLCDRSSAGLALRDPHPRGAARRRPRGRRDPGQIRGGPLRRRRLRTSAIQRRGGSSRASQERRRDAGPRRVPGARGAHRPGALHLQELPGVLSRRFRRGGGRGPRGAGDEGPGRRPGPGSARPRAGSGIRSGRGRPGGAAVRGERRRGPPSPVAGPRELRHYRPGLDRAVPAGGEGQDRGDPGRAEPGSRVGAWILPRRRGSGASSAPGASCRDRWSRQRRVRSS